MQQLGWIDGYRPRMVVVQTDACYPMVEAWKQGKSTATTFVNPAKTMANGLRVPTAFGDQMILEVVNDSNGCAIAVSVSSKVVQAAMVMIRGCNAI